MNYMVSRDGQQYGPYTLADLQRYVASGNILTTDLVQSEGATQWVPVSQVIGAIPVTTTPAPAPGNATQGVYYPPPPSLHWGIVLAIDIVTCGLFGWIWVLVQAAWVKTVQPASKAMFYLVPAIGGFVLAAILQFQEDTRIVAGVLNLASVVFWLIGVFSMRSSIEEHFNSAEPLHLRLSGVMTFFFNVIYFQYHFTEIARMKQSRVAGGYQP